MTRSSFSKLCSTCASKNTRSPEVYSSLESKLRKILLSYGLREKKDFFHNYRLRIRENPRITYYWLDFYLPRHRVTIEVDSLFHDYWNEKERNIRRDRELFDLHGIKSIHLREKHLNRTFIYSLLDNLRE